MTEYNIFEIIRSEKKNLSQVSLKQLGKVFHKYYIKYILDLQDKFQEIQEKDAEFIEKFNYLNQVEVIGNFIFHIFYCVYLSCFNIHISLFFLERATLLFFEFISLSIKEKEYKIESTSYLNDAIIFTYKKTIGNITIDQIIKENKSNLELQNSETYRDILKVRDVSFLISKIINRITEVNFEQVVEFKKNSKDILELLMNIYLKVNLDKYLFQNINKLLGDYQISISLKLIRIFVEVIHEFILLDYFEFNKEENDIHNFTNYLDNHFHNFIQCVNLDYILEIDDLIKNEKYQQFKDNVLRFISY